MKGKGAIGSHSTATSVSAWDGPGNISRLKVGQDANYYQEAYAWLGDEADGASGASYRFDHHEIDGEGNIGAANLRGCHTGIAVLNGAQGGPMIPDDDKVEVWRHLARHLEDADLAPPTIRQLQTGGHEHRSFQITDVEVETREGEEGPRITGYASVWDVLSEQIFGFREKFVKGAFRKTIKESDIRALFNHNPDLILGRTKNKTLTLREDQHGLHFDNTPPPTTYANDLQISIRRGDVDEVSIGFQKVKDKWEMDNEGIITRTVSEAKLYDVSPVAFAAYPQTDVQVRTALKKQGVDMDLLTGVLAKSERGTKLLDTDTDVLRRATGVLQKLLPGEPTQEGHSEGEQRLVEIERRLNSMQRKIDLISITEG